MEQTFAFLLHGLTSSVVSGGFWEMIVLGDGGKKWTLSQFRGRLVSEEGVGYLISALLTKTKAV